MVNLRTLFHYDDLTSACSASERTLDDSTGGKTPASVPTSRYSSTPEMKRLNLLPFDSKLMSSCLKVYNLLPNPSPGLVTVHFVIIVESIIFIL